MKIHIKNIVNILAALIVFCDAYSSRSLFAYFELRGSYFVLPIVFILCLIMLGRPHFNKNFIIVFSLLTVFSFYSIYLERSTIVYVSKVVISILLNSLTFYMVFKVNDYDVKKVFIIYINLAVIVSLVGLAQEFNNIFKILPEFGLTLPLSDLPFFRITSIFPEPAHYCEAMIPAFFVSLVGIFHSTELINKWKSWTIIIAFLLTFSTVGYFGVFVSIILIIINYNKIKYLIVGAFIIPILLLVAYFSINEVKLRVDGTYNVITGSTPLAQTNLSTFSLISNWEVGFISFLNNPAFGGGFGSHPISYMNYIPKVLGKDAKKLKEGISIMPLNVEDAGSLLNRLLSETGLFGLVAFLIFIIRGHLVKDRDNSNYLWIINNAILVFFILKLTREGHYFIYGVFLFFWAYYFSKLQSYRFNTEFES
jgi:hypothetical protein